MGFIRKATIIGSCGTARAVGVKGNSKKERNAEANEKMAKIEGKRFKAEQKVLKAEQRAAKVELQMSLRKASEARAAQAVAPSDPPLKAPAAPLPVSPGAAITLAPVPQGPPPGWYLDPDGGALQRWWDGTQWTEVKQASPSPHPTSISDVGPAARSTIFQPLASMPVEAPQPTDQEPSAPIPEKLQPGHLTCDGEVVSWGVRLFGSNQTARLKLSKLGHRPIKVKFSKDGTSEIHLAPGVQAVKGQSVELCAANLAEIAKFRPDVSVEVATPEIAESLRQAGVTLPISA